MMSVLKLHLLGPFHVVYKGETITDFRTDKARALLAYLALAADRPHRREALATLFWPEASPEMARRNLRVSLHRLRDALAKHVNPDLILHFTRETVQCRQDMIWVDAGAFDALWETVQHHAHTDVLMCAECLQRLQEAVTLYRGDFLEGFTLRDSVPFTEWATLYRERWHRIALMALYHLTEHHCQQGQWEVAEHYARRQLALEPWREEAHRQLMEILARKGEISAALAQYETCRRVLAQELNVEPALETQQLYRRICQMRDHGRDNLPLQTTTFIGREREMRQLHRLLQDLQCRLITLVGPPGVGKTRLALEAARAQRDHFLNGVYFIPLEEQHTAEGMAQAIATALNLPCRTHMPLTDQVIRHLQDWEALLLLDDLGALVNRSREAVMAFFSALFERAPRIKVLATSHRRLETRWEWVLPVEGLAWPGKDSPAGHNSSPPRDTFSLLQYPAIQLFWVRAQQVGQELSLAADGEAIIRICELVAGSPLGIELAATWVPTLSCREIASRLQRRLDRLRTTYADMPPRHQSLYAAFEHAWHFLSQEEQRVCQRLSIFPHTFTAEAAAHIAHASPLLLKSLVEQSLVQAHVNGRYAMHALWRHFSARKLQLHPNEAEATRRRFAQFYIAYLHQMTAQPSPEMAALREEIDNLRTAWEWAVQYGAWDLVEQAVHGMHYLHETSGWYQEGARLFHLALNRLSANEGPPLLAARLSVRLGWFYFRLSRFEESERLLRDGLARLPSHAMRERAFALGALGLVSHNQGMYDSAHRHYTQSLQLYRQLQDPFGMLRGICRLGLLSYTLGHLHMAHAYFQQAFTLTQKTAYPRGQAFVHAYLSLVLGDMGDYAAAQQHCAEAITRSQALHDPYLLALSLSYQGRMLGHQKRVSQARRVLHRARQLFQEIGDHQGEAYTATQLAEIAVRAREYKKAWHHYQTSYRLYQLVGNIAGAAESLGAMAYLSLLQGEEQQAAHLWRQSMLLLQGLKDPTPRDVLMKRWRHLFAPHADENIATSLLRTYT